MQILERMISSFSCDPVFLCCLYFERIKNNEMSLFFISFREVTTFRERYHFFMTTLFHYEGGGRGGVARQTSFDQSLVIVVSVPSKRVMYMYIWGIHLSSVSMIF